MSARYTRCTALFLEVSCPFVLIILTSAGVLGNRVLTPLKISAILGKNVTLGCRVEVASNFTLTQSAWERQMPSGSVTLAVYNPDYGTSIHPEYKHRLAFLSPSFHDATIVLEDVGYTDMGVYTCKVATFPLGNTQASTTVSVLVEPKVYVSAGSSALIDGANKTTVATCIAERARPPAVVSWESDLFGTSEAHLQDESDGTTTSQVHYTWQPNRHSQGHTITCVVHHPAMQSDFRIPFQLNVQFAPDILVVGYDSNWFVGRENVELKCKAKANPSAHHFRWMRLDGEMPQGVEVVNNSLVFARPLQRNDSGVYRCEVGNDIGLRSRDLRIRVHEPPTTTLLPTTAVPVQILGKVVTSPGNKQQALFTFPTLAPFPVSTSGAVIGGAVGGALFLLLLLVLGGIYFQRQQHTFLGNYYTKQCVEPVNMQKTPAPQELQQVCRTASCNRSTDKDLEEWGDCERGHAISSRSRALREGDHKHNHYQSTYDRPGTGRYPAQSPLRNGLEELFHSDYVSHTDGSMISRRE
ncbi:nectin-3-like protein isoform X2 [Denticeps clupeoides]|nr:nectin-3-like protein isoform X2 [Denticeps clupeoides]